MAKYNNAHDDTRRQPNKYNVEPLLIFEDKFITFVFRLFFTSLSLYKQNTPKRINLFTTGYVIKCIGRFGSDTDILRL